MHAGGQARLRGGRLDRHVPLVAGDVPVQLVVLVEEPQAVRHAVSQPDGPRRVLGARHPDLELAVVALAAALDTSAAAPSRR